ncbi:MAG TPA: hypothetical protein VN682_19875 [Terriglobales bacterium]|nr:hypothetical protein [Terriglobales bacterium]
MLEVPMASSKGPAPSDISSPNLDQFKNWLNEFHARYRPYQQDDDEGTSFLCCAAVLLTSAAAGSRNRTFLAQATGLPVEFVRLFCRAITRWQLWDSLQMWDLRETLRRDSSDFADIENSLQCLMEEVARLAWGPTLASNLQALRGNTLVGGLDQDGSIPLPAPSIM